jgi:2-polyprenyl-6-methoxyphenol hydroxylase-like FAD-dependent oxidoreductase
MTRVAIIGGGIGGLTAANALSRAGIEVAVYEAAASSRRSEPALPCTPTR